MEWEDIETTNFTKEDVLKLMEQKDEIERKINDLKIVLDSNGVGLKDPLTDSEGYPRNDIDIYKVRQTRHDINCLMNDHKDVMRQIEKGLHSIHGQMREGTGMELSQTCLRKHTQPFARISQVLQGSPAERAGLQDGDFVVEFGSVNYSNFKDLKDISAVVQHSVGKCVNVSTLRNGNFVSLNLKPGQWLGKGLLGCTVFPVDLIER